MSRPDLYRFSGTHAALGTDNGTQTRAEKPQVPAKFAPSNPPPPNQSQKDTKPQSKAEQKYRAREFIAEGKATVIADPDIRANKTVALNGLGNVMSGHWYVETVIHSWSRTGYNMELELRSNAAGGMEPPPKPASPPRKTAVKPNGASQSYTIKPGDTLSGIALKQYQNGSEWRKIWEANKTALIARDERNKESPGQYIHPGTELIIP